MIKRREYVLSPFLPLLVVSVFSVMVLGVLTAGVLSAGVRAVVGSGFFLFVPGFFLTYIFFPDHRSMNAQMISLARHYFPRASLDFVERITLSITLSIIIVSGIVYLLSANAGRSIFSQEVLFTKKSFFESVSFFCIGSGVIAFLRIGWRNRRSSCG